MNHISQSIHPGAYIKENIIPSGVNVTKAAELLGVSRPALSNLLNEKVSLSPEMAMRIEKAFGSPKDALLEMQQEYDGHKDSQIKQEIIVKTYAASFLDIKAMDINAWADQMKARALLAVLLRRLVHTSGTTVTKADFPGHDLSERPGWDGQVTCEKPNPWVPAGDSGWEFGCGQDYKKKAEKDYKTRSGLPEKERLETVFVFVTPRHWPDKAAWVAEKRAERKWKDVRAYDANDLEQWLENTPSAQVWMAQQLGIPTEGCQTLDDYWHEWAIVSEPSMSPKIFGTAIKENEDTIVEWLRGPNSNPLIITAASKEEGVAFVAAATRLSKKLVDFQQQAIFFNSSQPLKRLAGTMTEIIPIIFSHKDTEQSVISAFPEHKYILIYDKNLYSKDDCIEVSPPSYEAFEEAAKEMKLDAGTHASEIRSSSYSPTILRRLLAKTPGLRKPPWAQNPEYVRWMIPFVLLGRWQWSNVSDQEIIGIVANEHTNIIEQRLNELKNFEDAPILQEGRIGGVASRLESFNQIAPYVSKDDVERFMFVAECVLGEDDPSLDLEKSERWAAGIYDKIREYSETIRNSVADSLVLLAVHGEKISCYEYPGEVEVRVNSLIERLLKKRDSRAWLSQKDNFPCYAEAAPDIFLGIIEEELKKPDPVIDCLFEPVESAIFSSCDRLGILWALELLAWNPKRLCRVIFILAQLCRYQINDNYTNKPIGTIRDILLCWQPHTMATLKQRIEVLESLCSSYPDVGWSFCINQLNRTFDSTSGTYKPRWRNEMSEHDRVITIKDEQDFRRKCLDLVLEWPEFDYEKLKSLIDLLDRALKKDRDQIHTHIENWLATRPPQSEIANLREHVRTRMMTRRKQQERNRKQRIADGRKLFKLLEPSDLLQRHRWLFNKHWVEYSGDELFTDGLDYDAREKWIEKEQSKALLEIHEKLGQNGIYELCDLGEAEYVVGSILSRNVMSRDELLTFVTKAIDDQVNYDQSKLHQCVAGILGQLADNQLEAFLKDIVQAIVKRGGSDQTAKLQLLAPFSPVTWRIVAKGDQKAQNHYWKNVHVRWISLDDVDLNFCIKKLINVDRPRAAFFMAYFDFNKVKPEILTEILFDMGTKNTEPAEDYRCRSSNIIRALEAINKQGQIGSAKLAELEFMYVRAIGWHSGYKFPNLSREVANSSKSFFHLVALRFRRDDGAEDDPVLNIPKDPEQKKIATELAHSALENVTQVPGLQDDGTLNIYHLEEWIQSVRKLAKQHDREIAADHKIGALLQRCGIGDDGIWPRIEVREVMQKISSKEIAFGMHIAELNARGVQQRPQPDNGDQERELAKKYHTYGEAVMNSTPFVADLLFDLAKSYEQEAQHHDNKGRYQKHFSEF